MSFAPKMSDKISEGVLSIAANPPGKPKVWKTSNTSIGIKWSKPSDIDPQCTKVKYVIKEQQEMCDVWSEVTSLIDGGCETTLEVKPNVSYKFKVYCDCGPAGNSLDSEPSEDFIIKLTKKECLHTKLLENSDKVQSEKLVIYKPILKTVFCNDNEKIQKFEFGSEMGGAPEKVILVVGATGSGKTTLINGLINYIFAVDWGDDFRFKLITEPENQNQAKSQTTYISSYTIYHQEGFRIPYTLTIVDTPGFGDTAGIERDKAITQQIRTFFTTKGVCGIDHLDAVGFVAQSSLPRLTPTQRYIFDQILSLFGKDIAENIFMLLTFSDSQDPQVLNGIKEAKMPYKQFFKFNNSALYVYKHQLENTDQESDDDDEFDAMFWKKGEKSLKNLLKELNIIECRSLQLTKEVLNERNQLEAIISAIQTDIKLGVTKLEQLKREIGIIMDHEADIDRNKNFEYSVIENVLEEKRTDFGEKSMYCSVCNRICHERCGVLCDFFNSTCVVMSFGNCTACRYRCSSDSHKCTNFTMVWKQIKVKKTAEELRKRYQEASEKKMSAEGLVEKVKEEFEAVQLKVIGMTETVRKSLNRLKEIALKPNPLSAAGYIDILIASEIDQANPGWQSRCKQLQDVRKQTEYMQQLADKGFDPFKEYRLRIEHEEKIKKNGYWRKVMVYFDNVFNKKTIMVTENLEVDTN